MRYAIAAAVTLLAGCSESPEQPSAEPVTAPTVARSQPSAAAAAGVTAQATPRAVAIEGEYRIAGINGQDIDQPYAVTASIDGGRIHLTADCLNFAWSYSLVGDAIRTRREAVEGCGRGPTAAEEAIVAAFDAASTVARTPAGALDVSAPGHTVTLFSQ